jgi:hypothetical protein
VIDEWRVEPLKLARLSRNQVDEADDQRIPGQHLRRVAVVKVLGINVQRP